MALIIQQHTDNRELRLAANDMALPQQAQTGQMRGWLDAWNLHPSSGGIRMEWMGHATIEPMLGMASPEQTIQLTTLPVPEVEALFLELMAFTTRQESRCQCGHWAHR